MSKLCAYKINGTAWVDLVDYDEDDLNGNKRTIFGDTVISGYEDISTVANWCKYGLEAGSDYKYTRERIKQLYIDNGWGSLTQDEKEACAQLFVCTPAEQLSMYSLTDLEEYAYQFHKQSQECREQRLYRAESIIFLYLANQADKDETQDDVKEFLWHYIKWGREGTLEGDVEWIFDWLEARPGTSYSSNGWKNRSYPVVAGTLTDLASRVMSTLKNGFG